MTNFVAGIGRLSIGECKRRAYINALPLADAGADISICSGETASLSASGGTSYAWDNGAGVGSPVSVSPLSAYLHGDGDRCKWLYFRAMRLR
ncbi:MAG: hypothetical protein IPL33_13030 [Sphingobacteriales bacterium]|nr:hypothetical protein [Sphingobacteriales bacterium]